MCDTGGRKIYLHDLSTVCNTTVASVSWSVAGGGTYSGSSVSFLANAAGTYIVTMTVTDGLGNSCSKINSITLPGMPAADFTISPSSIICKGKAFHFTDASTGSIIFWEWRYGDYSEYYSYTTSSKQYLSVGINWQNTLFVFDSFSCIDSIDKFTTTAQNPLNGIIQPDSIYVCEGAPISLTCLHIPALGFTPNYLWSNGETTNPATDITAAGLYRVTVSDNNYCDLIPEKDAKVMFYPNPPLSIVGDDTVCMYQKFKKKVIPKGHGIYHWEREVYDVGSGFWLNNDTRVGRDLTTFRDSAFILGLYRYFILYFGDTPLSCTSLSDTVYTWVVDTPTINITDSTVLCHPFKVQLKANTSGPSNSPFDIRWSQGGYGRTIIANRSGLYGALFTDKFGCRAKDTISVQGPPDF